MSCCQRAAVTLTLEPSWFLFIKDLNPGSSHLLCLQVVFEAHAGGHRHYTLAMLLSPYSFTTTALVSDVPH